MVEAYRHVSHHAVRNRGTIGGSLCHNDPAAEIPLVVNLLGASLVARNKNAERVIAAMEQSLKMRRSQKCTGALKCGASSRAGPLLALLRSPLSFSLSASQPSKT
jgi:CO/xanthine dehydrogenase FAD-binding subunit